MCRDGKNLGTTDIYYYDTMKIRVLLRLLCDRYNCGL